MRGTKISNRHSLHISERAAALFHGDCMGPFRIKTQSGKRYMLVLVCDFTRMVFAFLLRSTSEFFETFKSFHSHLQALFRFDKPIAFLKLDGAKYFNKTLVVDMCTKLGIRPLLSPRGTPQYNPVAERAQLTLLDGARAMGVHGGAPTSTWGYGVTQMALITNLMPRKYRDKTIGRPIDKWPACEMSQVTLAHLRVMYCAAYKHSRSQESNPDKLGPKARKMLHAGWSMRYMSYRLLDGRTMYHSADVDFDEQDLPLKKNNPTSIATRNDDEFGALEIPPNAQPRGIASDPARPRRQAVPSAAALESLASEADLRAMFDAEPRQQGDRAPHTARGRRGRRRVREPSSPPFTDEDASDYDAEAESHTDNDDLPDEGDELGGHDPAALSYPGEFDGHAAWLSIVNETPAPIADPLTRRNAYESDQREEWKKAEELEMRTLIERGTWKLVERKHLRPGTKVMKSKWIYKIKWSPLNSGEIDKFKARFIVRGFGLTQGVHYGNSNAATVEAMTVKIFWYLVCVFKLNVRSSDFRSFFLEGDPDHAMYCEQAEGYEQGEKGRFVLLLLKGLYGTPPAPYFAQRKFDAIMKKLGFTKLMNDSRCFMLSDKRGVCIVINHVDDCVYGFNNPAMANELEAAWKKVFTCTIDYKPRTYLSTVIDLDRTAQTVHLSQAHKIQELLKLTGMDQCNSVSTPACISLQRKNEVEALPREQNKTYMTVVGKLIYISSARPDIAYAVNARCRRMSASDENDDLEAKRILRYLQGTATHRLKFDAKIAEHTRFFAYSDASFADAPGAKSTGATTITVGKAKNHSHCNIIAHHSFTQQIPAESAAEAELYSVCETAKSVQHVRNLAAELGLPQREPTTIYTDSNAVIDGLKSPDKARTRHYRRRQWKLRYLIMHRIISIVKVHTDENIADLGTKALGATKHAHFCKKFLAI